MAEVTTAQHWDRKTPCLPSPRRLGREPSARARAREVVASTNLEWFPTGFRKSLRGRAAILGIRVLVTQFRFQEASAVETVVVERAPS